MTAPHPLLGHILDDKYRLDAVLGAGGMGVVYRATDLRLDRAVAVKLVRAGAGAVAAERFEREARAVARLRHPHIVTIHDVGVAEPAGAYLVMELLEGRSLRDELDARGRLSAGEVVEIGRQACRALQAAHEAGVVHRDVKPDNVFLERAGGAVAVKVLDFGIAKMRDAAAAGGDALTLDGTVMGTPAYMSPEQCFGEELDGRSDVYALGCVLYEAVAGRPPFASQSAAALQLKHVSETPARPSRYASEVPAGLEAAVLRALAKRPEERFATAAEFGRALEASGLDDRPEALPAEPTVIAAAAPRHAFEFPPFRLPVDIDVLYRDGELVTLERQAVRVLRYLVEHRERVVSKQELFERLWPDVFTTDSVLMRLVSLVRRALGDDAKEGRYVRTFHGQGYQFVAPVAEARATDEPAARVGTAAGARAATPAGGVTNLPHPVTSFVGREGELSGVRDALGRSRLVTLVGPGGIGKTRLAVEAARGELGEYADGVWLVELVSLADPAVVPGAVASALGVSEEAGRALADTLVERMAPKRLLLVLDNCEHLIDACAELVERLLPACGGLRVLATSREALDVDGEAVWPVPALAVDASADCEAVRLFVERAQSAASSFALTPRNAGALARLCERLEGIPLSIELAAARVRTMPVDEILARVSDRFALLARTRDRGGRHQTLRATIDWSYELLSEEERALFRRLSVFAGGWTLEAAEAISSAENRVLSAEVGPSDPQHSALSTQHFDHDVVDLLTHLADKSLVLVDRRGGDARYRLLETVREYAREKLVEAGEDALPLARHRDWFVGWAERSEAELYGPEQGAWFARFEAEHDNFRAALRRGLRDERGADACLRLCAALGRFWTTRGYRSEALSWHEAALAHGAGAGAHARARGLYSAGCLVSYHGDFERAQAYLNEAMALQRALGDTRGLGKTLFRLGVVFAMMGQDDRAVAPTEESAALARECGDLQTAAWATVARGYIAFHQGDLDRAVRWYEEGVAISRERKSARDVAAMLPNLAEVLRQRGDFDRAEACLVESCEIARDFGDRGVEAISRAILGRIALGRGDGRRALSLSKEALAIFHELNDRVNLAIALEGLACVFASQGDAQRALRLAGASARLCEEIGLPLRPYGRRELDRYLLPARQALGEGAEPALAKGRAMSAEQAVRYALGSS